jgi:hypothetical protein
MGTRLPVADAQAELFKLLSDNNDCLLPCLWGIVPGVSTFHEARTILAPLRTLSHSVYLDPPGPGSIEPRYTEGDFEIYTLVAFLVNPDDGIVESIGFNLESHKLLPEGGYENMFDSKFFSEKASAYMLSHVLSKQGIPESVVIFTSGGPLTRGGTGGFEIVLLYPSQGVFVHYTTQMHIIGKNVRGCPQDAHVWMELYPSEDTVNFFAQLEKTTWQYFKDGFKPLEETTSISVEEFYETFREPTDKCIETLASLWPTPEP